MSPSGGFGRPPYGDQEGDAYHGGEVQQQKEVLHLYYHDRQGMAAANSREQQSTSSGMTGYYEMGGATSGGSGEGEDYESGSGLAGTRYASQTSSPTNAWYGGGPGARGARGVGGGGGSEGGQDEMVASYSEDDAEDLDARMSRYSNTMSSRYENHSRSKSMMRYSEIERERTRRRQHIVKQKAIKKFSPGTIKLSMMNAGIIPLKKAEKDALTSEFYEKPVAVTDFQKHCAQRRKYPVLLQIEFNSAIREREIPNMNCRHGSRRINQEKNQNPRIIPYDYNRVVLESEDGEPDSDYVNASYVDSLVQPKAYIVTQGPTETTIGDFWRMVWQEKASCIVMVTRTFDFIRVMCVQYWPAGRRREEVYSGVGVMVENEEQLANFMIRTIRLRKGEEERKVMLFHYTEWPCHSNPFSNALLEFRRRVRNVMNHHPDAQDGPVIVHCNDGAGRSGVYLAIDANIELSEEDGVFDVYGYLKKMRQQRRGLIETVDQFKFLYETLLEYTRGIDSRFPVSELANKIKERGIKDKKTKKNAYQMEYTPDLHQATYTGCLCENCKHNLCIKFDMECVLFPREKRVLITNEQYKFVYDTLEEFALCGYTFFPINEISHHLKQKSLKNKLAAQKINEYEKEYTLITNQTPRFSIGDCAAGHRADNREKNRNVLIVPPDNFRPYITSFQGNNCTDYINAVFVDGYTHPREYIVTEWPMPCTCSDIWSLVYDHDCSAVVVLCNPTSTVSSVYPSFWPENTRSKKYGQVFTVEHISHGHTSNIRSWIFKINKKIVSLTELMAGVKAPSKTCQLFQLMCWPQGHKVPTSTNALVELMNMVERWRQKTEFGPVVVVSQDGQSRAGVYCAANACIEQVIQHGEVDVFQAVKTVRRHRPQLVENITEYKYCYDLVLHYVLHYLHKEDEYGRRKKF